MTKIQFLIETIVLKYLIVKFPDREAKFLYPGAFEKGYLRV